jgi:hypothetical protein
MKPTSMCVVAMWLALAGLCLARSAAAQTPDQPYGKVKGFPGVFVTDAQGSETKGKLVSWTGSEIVLQTDIGPRIFKPGEAVRLDLRGDSVKNGALIGLAVGVAMGALASAGCDCGNAAIVSISAGMYTLMGVGVDALIPGRTPLWNAGARKIAGNGLTFRLSPERRSAFVGWRIK